MAEVIPIGTILAVLSNQIIKTAQAAKDVVFEKESFKVLAKHLLDIEPVLKELQSQQLNDSPSARQALESLETDVKKANKLIDKYKSRARFYLLVKCRHIVKEMQDVTREIGNSLSALSLANIKSCRESQTRCIGHRVAVRADAARDYEEIKKKSLHGTACERAALESWFECGEKTDPETGEVLRDFSYRSNVQLRQSIEEWRELNYCVRIRSCRAKLVSGVDSCVEMALDQVKELVGEDMINKDWISIGGVTDVVVNMVGGMVNADVKRRLLVSLKDIVDGHARNKDIFIENQGIEKIVPCLGLDSSISKAAVELLHEVLHDRSGWNALYCMMLSQQCDAIPLLVSLLKSQVDETAKIAEEFLAKLCDVDENIIQAAKVNWFRPLIDKVIQGSASLRISMVKELVTLELDEEKIKLLGEEGIIPPLLEMASGNVESKELSLHALVMLSTFRPNKHLIASAGGVPLILNLLSSNHIAIVIAKCAEILANLSSNGDGTKFLVDETGIRLELQPVTTSLLSFQQNLNSLDIVRKPALRALLGICQSEAELIKSAVLSASGVSVILSLLDDSNQEIRELAINLLFLFSQHQLDGVVEYLLKPRRLEALVGFLENCNKSDVQMAAAGLLANLPKSETSITEKLIELGGLKAIIDIIKSGTMDAKENALSALFRFTDPTNLESQRKVVELGAYDLLTSLLKVDSVTASARAAALLGDLSMRSQELSLMNRKHSCFCFLKTRLAVCRAHGGSCSVNTTFCLLEGNVLSDLVRLLRGKVHATAYEAIQTLSTLVQEDFPQRGANVLHENGAIGPTIEVLRWGSESLKGEALSLLEKVFVLREMVDFYGSTARSPLMQLTCRGIFEDGHLQRKATKILLLIERYSRSSSTSLVVGLND
ncbi:hypothetical protein DH2020_019881 [Rehmannia glutinosa]|uniref:RPW8 domain-containing protein n=1 Tax=Rehmannia glutinosa TaxID=99300 RepID=A0ABR0WEI4_REHGL